MTATSYVTLDNDDLGANKIFRAATASALNTNPISMAQRGTGAPWLNGIGAMTAITSGSGNWTVPDGVYRIKVTATGGGGGGGNGSSGTDGTDTTFSTLTAGGGKAGDSAGACTGSASAESTAFPPPVSYNHLRAHETDSYLVCRLLLEQKKRQAPTHNN